MKRGLGRFTNTIKYQSNNSPPGITTAEVFAKQKKHTEAVDEVDDEEEEGEEDDKEVKSLLNPPVALPTQLQKKKMIALAVEVGVKATMLGHMYQIDGKVFL